MRPVHRGRWAWAPVILVAATVTGALTGPLASAASPDGGNRPLPRHHRRTATRRACQLGEGLAAREYVVDALKPGTTIHRRMEVSNTTTSLQHVTVYAAAAAITRGSFVGAAAHTANVLTDQVGNGPWNATVTLRSGLNQESFRGQITFAPGTRPAASPSPSAAVSASARSWPSRPSSCC